MEEIVELLKVNGFTRGVGTNYSKVVGKKTAKVGFAHGRVFITIDMLNRDAGFGGSWSGPFSAMDSARDMLAGFIA